MRLLQVGAYQQGEFVQNEIACTENLQAIKSNLVLPMVDSRLRTEIFLCWFIWIRTLCQLASKQHYLLIGNTRIKTIPWS
jgi:hypothetical protein